MILRPDPAASWRGTRLGGPGIHPLTRIEVWEAADSAWREVKP